jgi:MFS family permease
MRILQGLGGAMMIPVGRLILLRSFPRSELMTAMTYMTLPAIIGPIIGPLLGGFLTTYLSWRWIFYVNLPFGLVGMLLAMRFVENFRELGVSRFDFRGFLMVGCGLGLFQFGVENVSRPVVSNSIVAITIIAAIMLLAGFGLYAKNASAPAVDLSLFRMRSFRVGTLAGGLCRIGMNGVPFMLPLMLQVGFGFTPIASGSITFVGSIGAVLIRGLVAPVLRRYEFKTVLIGSAIAGSITLAGFALLGPQTPHWVILLYVFIFGVTRAAQFMTSNTLTYSDIPDTHLSRATSLGGILQQLSVSFGISVSAVLLGIVSRHLQVPSIAQFHYVYMLTAVIPLMAIPGFMELRTQDGIKATGRQFVISP